MTNNCAVCGANLDMVGRSHRCIPRPTATARHPEMGKRTAPVPVRKVGAESGGPYKYRDTDKWRAYMRDYMRTRRGSKLNVPKSS